MFYFGDDKKQQKIAKEVFSVDGRHHHRSAASDPECVAVIDIGKTHLKVHVLHRQDTTVFSRQISNAAKDGEFYSTVDMDKIWSFLLDALKQASKTYDLHAISISTHGATAALVNVDAKCDDKLVLPILDYEHVFSDELFAAYEALRPSFTETYSPSLPAGLNLARQLFCLKHLFPKEFESASHVLMFPQYIAYRLTGTLCNEVSSLGCHTDLWDPVKQRYSSAIHLLDIADKLPPIMPAWASCGHLLPELQNELGIASYCELVVGIHDSNASLVPYLRAKKDKAFTVVSTGTWTISMAVGKKLERLDANKDMLANVSATGQAIACARFMGGREFAHICRLTDTKLDEAFSIQDIQALIDAQVFALPSFAEGCGPFAKRKGELVAYNSTYSGTALASLYCALMIDHELTLLGNKNEVFIEGAFLQNPLLCALVKALGTAQQVYLSPDNTGTVRGAAQLAHWHREPEALVCNEVDSITIDGLVEYKSKWQEMSGLIPR